ncbi:syntaxin-16-like [Watersipora subatra]|uniref:syntaxin-16-like n=1 Tax=Watersipora subatra TaxID=2589382 RepID=UPI00355B5523
MASRSLTDVFLLMRNNAVKTRHIYADTGYDDRTALVSSDVESGAVSYQQHSSKPTLPPEWVDGVEEIQRRIPQISKQMTELSSLHTRHLNRPSLDDSIDEEKVIERQTSGITKMFQECQSLVHRLNTKISRCSSPQQSKLARNVMASIARELQDLSGEFRRSQSDYLEKMKSREERAAHLFGSTTDTHEFDSQGFEEIDLYDKSFAREHTQMVQENTHAVEQREQAIKHIAQSIVDLNIIFKDLAAMIVDQGTVLDRIDYNIEHTAVSVEEGHKQLVQAEKYQKKNRKMIVILVLAGICVILIIVLIAVKS